MALSTLNSGAEHAREKIVRELQGTRFDISGFIFRFSLLFGLGSGAVSYTHLTLPTTHDV